MIIQLKKGRDGRSTLACVRADGSRTWAKVHPFFPVHDLTHAAVETVFGFDQAFFGLVAGGWDLNQFAAPGATGRLPAQAIWAECIVGLLDRERLQPEPYRGTELVELLTTSLSRLQAGPFRPVTDDELARVRALVDAHVARWAALAPGETLEVGFPMKLQVAVDTRASR
jgi:hypothetical protein